MQQQLRQWFVKWKKYIVFVGGWEFFCGVGPMTKMTAPLYISSFLLSFRLYAVRPP